MRNNDQTSFERSETGVFNSISDLEVKEAALALNGAVHRFSKADYINFEEDWVNVVAIVLSGSINIIAENILGNNVILASLNRGSIICESIFGDKKSSVDLSYFVASDSEILMLPAEELRDLNNDNGLLTKLLFNICIMMASDSMRLIEKISILNQRCLRDKILAYLRMQAIYQGSDKVEIPFNRTQLADYLNADRTSMTRELYLLKEEGLIDFKNNSFEIKFDI